MGKALGMSNYASVSSVVSRMNNEIGKTQACVKAHRAQAPNERPDPKTKTLARKRLSPLLMGSGSTITQGSLKYYDYIGQAAQCNICRPYKRMQKAPDMSQEQI